MSTQDFATSETVALDDGAMLRLSIEHRFDVGFLHFQHSLRGCFSRLTLANDLNELAPLDSSMKFGRDCFVCR